MTLREADIDRLIVEAYTRQPPEDVWGEQSAKLLIAAEPWLNRTRDGTVSA